MTIEFNPSKRATLGVEWELQLVDRDSGHLRQDAQKLLEELPELSGAESNPPLRHELMQSTIEVVTGICETVDEVKEDLSATVARLTQAADGRGIELACAGTHPIDDWRDQEFAPSQRYSELIEQMQWLARRILTFGVHVHVGVTDRDKVIPIVNALSRYLPHFLALTASSPFWSGHDTGLASSRSIVFGALPTAGPPPRLAHWGAFEEYMDTLLRAGTITSIKEVWWDIRPHPETDNKWRATRYGLDARIIIDERGSTVPLRDDLYELLHELRPIAERLGCAEDLDVVAEILHYGASYERQRAIIRQGGVLKDVVDALVKEFRAGAPAVGSSHGRTDPSRNGGPSHAGA